MRRSSQDARSDSNNLHFDGISTIFFDFGGTIAYWQPNPNDIFNQALMSAGIDQVDRRRLNRAYRESYFLWSRKMYGHLGHTDRFVIELYHDILNRLKIPDAEFLIAGKIANAFRNVNYVHLYPECMEVLTHLKNEGYLLGIISNSTDEILLDIKDLKIDQLFDSVTFSQEVGAEKPKAAIFKKALERMNVKPIECIHVGDSYGRDIFGAYRVGIRPILLERKPLATSKRNNDCICINSLKDLLRIIDNG